MTANDKLYREIRASIPRSSFPTNKAWKLAVKTAMRDLRKFRRQEATFKHTESAA